MTPVGERRDAEDFSALRIRVERLLSESAAVRRLAQQRRLELLRTRERLIAFSFDKRPNGVHPPRSAPAAAGKMEVPPAAPANGGEGLTAREQQVLRLIVDGQSTKQIAFTLGVSFKTAATHRWRVMQKLDVHETASLVRLALERRLISI